MKLSLAVALLLAVAATVQGANIDNALQRRALSDEERVERLSSLLNHLEALMHARRAAAAEADPFDDSRITEEDDSRSAIQRRAPFLWGTGATGNAGGTGNFLFNQDGFLVGGSLGATGQAQAGAGSDQLGAAAQAGGSAGLAGGVRFNQNGLNIGGNLGAQGGGRAGASLGGQNVGAAASGTAGLSGGLQIGANGVQAQGQPWAWGGTNAWGRRRANLPPVYLGKRRATLEGILPGDSPHNPQGY